MRITLPNISLALILYFFFSPSLLAFYEAPSPKPSADDKIWLQKHSINGVFADFTTKLIWQDDAGVINNRRALSSNTDNTNSSTSSLSAFDYCEHLDLAGYSDWKLPRKTALIDLYRDFSDKLKHKNNGMYWSSTPTNFDSKMYWYVSESHPGMGAITFGRKHEHHYVRCVRKSTL